MEGIGGKGWSAEGNAPEKVATRPLPLRCACGPLPLMMPRVAHFSGASPSADLQIQHSPSLGVPANGPQTTETGENVVWCAGGWTSKDGKRKKRVSGDDGQEGLAGKPGRQMELKRRKQAKPSLGVPANGPQTTETGRSVVWGASRWTSNAENGQKRRLGCRHMDLKRRKRAKTSLGVPANGPQTPETGETVVWGAGEWTSNDGNGRERRLGCWRMDL